MDSFFGDDCSISRKLFELVILLAVSERLYTFQVFYIDMIYMYKYLPFPSLFFFPHPSYNSTCTFLLIPAVLIQGHCSIAPVHQILDGKTKRTLPTTLTSHFRFRSLSRETTAILQTRAHLCLTGLSGRTSLLPHQASSSNFIFSSPISSQSRRVYRQSSNSSEHFIFTKPLLSSSVS